MMLSCDGWGRAIAGFRSPGEISHPAEGMISAAPLFAGLIAALNWTVIGSARSCGTRHHGRSCMHRAAVIVGLSSMLCQLVWGRMDAKNWTGTICLFLSMEIFREILRKADTRETGQPRSDQVQPHWAEQRRQEIRGLFQVSFCAQKRVRRRVPRARRFFVRPAASASTHQPRRPRARRSHGG